LEAVGATPESLEAVGRLETTAQAMILIGYYESPFVRRVAVTMLLYGMAFEHRPYSTTQDQSRIRPFNPLGRIPALVLDDGDVLTDSGMILDYLDRLVGPAKALTPEGGARRSVNQLVALAEGTLDKYVAAYYERTKRPEAFVYRPWLEHLEGQVAAGLEALNGHPLGPWLCGETLTQADVTTAVAVAAIRFDMAHLSPPGRYPNLDALTERAAALDAFKKTAF
jgi:glutathione S-transferase